MPPPRRIENFRPRDSRVYWHVIVGPGIAEFDVEGLSDSRAVTYNFTGTVGYAVIPDVILAFEMAAAGAPKSGIWFDVNSNWTNETSFGYLSLGPAVLVYAPFDSYASLGVGFSFFTLSSDVADDAKFEVMSKAGLAATLTLGHDFRLSKRFWMGVAAQLHYARATGDDLFFERRQISARGVGLGLSAGMQ